MDKDAITIRKATPADASAIQSLVKSLAHFYCKEPNLPIPAWLEDTLTLASFRGRLSDSEYDNRVMEVRTSEGKAELLGYIAMRGGSHLYHLFVAEEHQGKGYSTALWKALEEDHKQDAYTVRSSLNAVPVYRRLGFMPVGEVAEKDGIGYQVMKWAI